MNVLHDIFIQDTVDTGGYSYSERIGFSWPVREDGHKYYLIQCKQGMWHFYIYISLALVFQGANYCDFTDILREKMCKIHVIIRIVSEVFFSYHRFVQQRTKKELKLIRIGNGIKGMNILNMV